VTGKFHTCASVRVDGKNKLGCFGDNSYNSCELSTGLNEKGDFTDVKAGQSKTCYLNSRKELHCFGGEFKNKSTFEMEEVK